VGSRSAQPAARRYPGVMRLVSVLLLAGAAFAQDKRYVVIDQDAMGPGGTDMMSILVLILIAVLGFIGYITAARRYR
jgi:hypothetical protein